MSTSGHHGARGTDGAALGVAHLELALTAATVDLLHGAVQRDGAVLHLTPLELRLLRHLVAVSPRPVDRAELEREVWGYAAGVDSHTVLSTVHRLRQKIERDPRRPDHLVTDRGRGYVLLAPTRSEPTAAASSLPFFGRAELVAAVVAAVGAHRLVSLVGTGGVGKTRLAREVVARLSQRPDDHPELRFIELAEATRAADVQHALGHALGVALAGKDPWTGLAHALESLARPVLVLDNLEQVLDAARAPIARLLGQVPRLVILATSREALGVDGERVVPVPALEPAEAEALFVDRHQRASPSASPITSADLAAIVEACEHLPLALFFGESPRGRAEAAGARAIAAWYRGDVEAGLRAAEVALRGYEALGVARRQVQVRLNRGYFLLDLGRHDEALRSLERGLEGARTGRLQRYLTGALSFIGMLHHDRGDLERARGAYREVAHVSRRQGRVDYSARARIHEAALPGPADVRAHLLHDALDLAERAAMPAVEAEALATWVRLDPTRADLRARAERLLAQPGTVPSPIRELVRLLLGETLDPAEVARRAMWRIATRLVPFA